jgi:hypothetical protein
VTIIRFVFGSLAAFVASHFIFQYIQLLPPIFRWLAFQQPIVRWQQFQWNLVAHTEDSFAADRWIVIALAAALGCCFHRRFPLPAAWLVITATALRMEVFLFRSPKTAIAALSFTVMLILFGFALRWLNATLADLKTPLRIFVLTVVVGSIVFFAPMILFRFGRWLPTRFLLIGITIAFVLALLGAAAAQWRVLALPLPGWKQIATTTLAAMLFAGLTFGVGHHIQQAEREHAQRQLDRLPAASKYLPYPKIFFQRGVSLVADRVPFGSAYTQELVSRLQSEVGVDALALVAHCRFDRETFAMTAPDDEESNQQIEILTRFAHQRQMRVMLKPQCWQWQNSKESDLPTAPLVDRWFAQYQKYILAYAEFAQTIHADLFCIGTELAWLTRDQHRWRPMIAEIRKRYSGPITLAASHGPEFEHVQFWDALDYIGLDNYQPLEANYSTEKIIARIEVVQTKFQKPVLFTEAGFGSFPQSHLTPWEFGDRRPVDLQQQVTAYRALLQAFYGKPYFQGVYWWKVDTGGRGGATDPTMLLSRKPVLQVLSDFYSR